MEGVKRKTKNKEKQRNSAGYESRTGKEKITPPAGVSVVPRVPPRGYSSWGVSSRRRVLHHQSHSLVGQVDRYGIETQNNKQRNSASTEPDRLLMLENTRNSGLFGGI